MRGYEVVTSDERRVGRVVDVRDGYVVVESGRLWKARRPVPQEFTHPDDEAEKVIVTVPRRVLLEAPKVDQDGVFDVEESARHYGLAGTFVTDPETGEPRSETIAEQLDGRSPASRRARPAGEQEPMSPPGVRR